MSLKTTKWECKTRCAFLAQVLGDVARSVGMSRIARDAGLSREGLYKALSAEGNPSLRTVLKVLRALGLRIHIEPAPVSLRRSSGAPARRPTGSRHPHHPHVCLPGGHVLHPQLDRAATRATAPQPW